MNAIPTTSSELLDSIAELHRCYPDWRIGQLVANVAGWADREIWDVDDDALLAAIRLHLRERQTTETVVDGQLDNKAGQR